MKFRPTETAPNRVERLRLAALDNQIGCILPLGLHLLANAVRQATVYLKNGFSFCLQKTI